MTVGADFGTERLKALAKREKGSWFVERRAERRWSTLWGGYRDRETRAEWRKDTSRVRVRRCGRRSRSRDDGHYALDRHSVAIDVEQLEDFIAQVDAADTPADQLPRSNARSGFAGEPLSGWEQPWADPEIRRLCSIHAELTRPRRRATRALYHELLGQR